MSETNSLNVSETTEHERQHRYLLQNVQLVIEKVEQQSKTLETASNNFDQTRREMQTTMELAQQMISQQDEQIQRLEQATAALLMLSRGQSVPKQSAAG